MQGGVKVGVQGDGSHIRAMMKAVLALLFGHRSLFTVGTIHVNTDLMRQLGSLFAQLNEQIASQLEPQIQHLIGQLESDWLGVSRQHFETALSEWRATASRLVVNGEELGRHLQETAARFDNADQF